MATRYSMFPSVSGDEFYVAADFLQRPAQETFARTGDGVSREVGGSMQVTETSPASMAVDVALGVARIDGWRFEIFTGAETVSLDAADGTDDRVDRIVLRARTGSANRDVILDKLTGTPASSPSAPALTRSGDTYEISLAQVLVGAGVSSVTNSDITDERGDNSLCGWLQAQDSALLEGKTTSQIGTSELNNDANFVSDGDNVSLLTNDANYISNGDNVSLLANDANYISDGDNVSLLNNNANYIATNDDATLSDLTLASGTPILTINESGQAAFTLRESAGELTLNRGATNLMSWLSSNNVTSARKLEADDHVGVGTSSQGAQNDGVFLQLDGTNWFNASGTPMAINRDNLDGNLISFFHNQSVEGAIEVSGSTVSLTGGHLARWSQLPGLAPRKDIPRGTVMASVDEMCTWFQDVYESEGKGRKRLWNPHHDSEQRGVVQQEDNEQLMRCDVSSTPGDRRVYGIFERWDDDEQEGDDPWEHDFFIACAGDFPVRVTGPVNGGDLLESNGDGTVRAQADDLVRAGTIAKASMGVTSAGPAEENLVPCQLLIG